jgi:hypothetical protein
MKIQLITKNLMLNLERTLMVMFPTLVSCVRAIYVSLFITFPYSPLSSKSPEICDQLLSEQTYIDIPTTVISEYNDKNKVRW